MKIYYDCNGEGSSVMSLGTLILNFTAGEAWNEIQPPMTQQSLVDQMTTDGFVTGTHSSGTFIVVDIAKIDDAVWHERNVEGADS